MGKVFTYLLFYIEILVVVVDIGDNVGDVV